MSEGIFFETATGLELLAETPYEKELVLQTALEKYPEVIAGISTTGDSKGQLALIKREIGVPGEQEGSSVWSLDHLFVDRDARPIFVEVKRSTDTRIRREVVGQMLDYAANGSKYWPAGHLRDSFESRIQSELVGELDPSAWLQQHLGVDDADEYWQRADENLRYGHVRLVFVADKLPAELVRIIEFLNEQMEHAEVLGVELRQYMSESGVRAFVPTVVGRTATAMASKSAAKGGQTWTKESFLAVAEERRSPEEVEFIRRLLQHVLDRGGEYRWGNGVTPGMSGWYPVNGEQRPVFNLNLNAEGQRAYLSFYLADLANRIPHTRVEEALYTLEKVPTFASRVAEARASDYRKWPTAYVPDLVTSEGAQTAVIGAIEVFADPPETDGVNIG